MVQPLKQDDPRHEALSAMADGEASPHEAEQMCAAWRDDAEARGRWHTYHLIGDVLRSDELARPAAHDAAFLERLRGQLAQEPVILAPQPVPAPAQVRRARQRWLFPAAAAAGFVVVAGVLVVTRLSAPDPAGGAVLVNAPAAPSTVPVPSFAAGAEMIRDAELDAYLNAHQSARGSAAMAVPGTGLRNADVVVPAGTGR